MTQASETAVTLTPWQIRAAKLRLGLRGLREGWSVFRESRIGVLGLAVIVIFALMAISHPILMATIWDDATYNPVTGYAFDETEQPAPPSWRHPLGTDPLGRDILSQLLSSTSSEFILGLVAATVTVSIATTVGAVAAYYRGLVDTFFMRLADLIVALPGISLLIVLSALFELNLFILGVIIGVLGGFGGTAIVLKSQALGVSVKPLHRGCPGCGRRAIPYHSCPHHSQPPAPVVPVYDVHRYRRHIFRGGVVVPGAAQHPR